MLRSGNKFNSAAAALLIAMFIGVSISSLAVKSPTFDEMQHLSCGFAVLKSFNPDIGPGHPVLFRAVIGVPMLFIDPEYDKEHYIFSRKAKNVNELYTVAPDYDFGYSLFYKYNNNADTMFFWGRTAAVLFGVIALIVIFAYSRMLFGPAGALFSLFLASCSPSLIAHSRLTVNDAAGAAGIILTLFIFSRYLRKNTYTNLIITGAVMGAAMLLKLNAVLLMPFIFIIMLIREKITGIAKFTLMTVIAVIVINAAYGFNSTFAMKTVPLEVFSKVFPFGPLNPFIHWLYSYFPLPSYFLDSFVFQQIHNFHGHSAFIMGQYSIHGWWYFFPVAFLLKTPVITLIFLLLMFAHIFRKRILSVDQGMLIAFFFYYFLFAVTAKINIGHRHILPVYPVMFVLLGSIPGYFSRYLRYRSLKYGVPLIYIISAHIFYPHYLPYFNGLVLPGKGYKYLVDSNLDWGQDLKLLEDYLEKEGDPALILSYFGTASRKYYGIIHQELLNTGMGLEHSSHINPVEVERELLAVSATNIQGVYYPNRELLKWVLYDEPVKNIGYSIRVYDITENPAAYARIAEIYRVQGLFTHAERNYRRIMYIRPGTKEYRWAENRLMSLKEESGWKK